MVAIRTWVMRSEYRMTEIPTCLYQFDEFRPIVEVVADRAVGTLNFNEAMDPPYALNSHGSPRLGMRNVQTSSNGSVMHGSAANASRLAAGIQPLTACISGSLCRTFPPCFKNAAAIASVSGP